jgi:hypothetical protein
MNYKLELLSTQIMDAIEAWPAGCPNDPLMDIDSMDSIPKISEDGTRATFTISKHIDKPSDGFRKIPVGHITYKVTIEASYTSIDD